MVIADFKGFEPILMYKSDNTIRFEQNIGAKQARLKYKLVSPHRQNVSVNM